MTLAQPGRGLPCTIAIGVLLGHLSALAAPGDTVRSRWAIMLDVNGPFVFLSGG
jgi:hypothetical protein